MVTTGALLVAAFVVFLTGAGFWLVSEFEQPLEIRLRAVAVHRRRWLWIHAWMIAGTLVSLWAVSLLGRLLLSDGGGRAAIVGLAAFSIGGLAMLASLAFGLTATPRAARETVSANAVPTAFRGRQRYASALYVIHMLLSYATFVALGFAMLRGSLFPAWLGWSGVAIGLLGVLGFLLMRGGPFGPPILAHSYGLLVGIVMLVTR